MLAAIKNDANKTYTENGALTYKSSMSDCLDLFSTIGALRNGNTTEIIRRFTRAYTENADIAMKILFFARDVRGGLGERRVFRTIVNNLANSHPESVKKNIKYFGEYGRYDDLLWLFDTSCQEDAIAHIDKQLKEDIDNAKNDQSISLLAKWMPSINASNRNTIKKAKKLADALNMTPAEYRKTLSFLRAKMDLVENNIREKDYSFDYNRLPSKALYKYRNAFYRNDEERYYALLKKVVNRETKLNASTIMPYELVEPYIQLVEPYVDCFEDNIIALDNLSKAEKDMLNATWYSLPDFYGEENALAVVDTSGSMYCQSHPTPAAVALSLGIYIAERNKGIFHNTFIEFSERPQLIELKGDTFVDKLRYILTFEEIADTNLMAVFELILEAAVNNSIPQEELPSTLYIISDMEFNQCISHSSRTNFENAKLLYEAFGYKLPKVVFWNVASRKLQQPVKMNKQGVALISGCTPNLFSRILANDMDPYGFMMDAISSERYTAITA